MDIKIEIDDDRTYAQVAYFVDNPLIAGSIRSLQKHYKITSPINYDLNSIEGYFIKLSGYDSAQYKFNHPTPTNTSLQRLFADLNHISSVLFQNNEKLIKDQKVFTTVTDLFNAFLTDISETRRPFFYPRMFDSVVFQAVLFSEVKYFKSAYATTINSPAFYFEAKEDTETDRDVSTVIMVMHNSTQEDIMEAFSDIRTNYRKVLQKSHPLTEILDKDSVSNIRQQRYWYWQMMEGRQALQLAEEWNKQPNLHEKETEHGRNGKYCSNCLIYDPNRIEKFVKRYRDILKIIG